MMSEKLNARNHHHGEHHHHHHGPGHNHSHDHMHSHVHTDPDKEKLDRLSALAAAFMEGFRKAEDKPAFLELSGVPQSRQGSDGFKMHLIDVAISSTWQMGTASPAFMSKDLAYLPYPSSMINERETLTFTYVSLTERYDLGLLEFLKERE